MAAGAATAAAVAAVALGAPAAWAPVGCSATTAVGLALGWVWARRAQQGASPADPVPRRSGASGRSAVRDAADLVDQLLQQGRAALLLRPQILQRLTPEQADQARRALQDTMALVAAGVVVPGFAGHVLVDGSEPSNCAAHPVALEAYYLDRYCVTNAQFQEFVNDGGYQDEALWNPEIWPAVPDLVDSTGCPGPRYWAEGTYRLGEEDLPVVGVNWYEACAFARWAGKRLPTSAEWEKAASCPVQIAPGTVVQRKYPWGESMDRARANVWGSEPGRVVAVHAFGGGACAGGIYQLIGNVWEWTADDFHGRGQPRLILPTPMKAIRGGAFDTYCDNQATCQYESGDTPMSRKHNIGFRCALSAAELEPVLDEFEGALLDAGPHDRAADSLSEARA
jgi:iron(II)-dependent oxidoreductase